MSNLKKLREQNTLQNTLHILTNVNKHNQLNIIPFVRKMLSFYYGKFAAVMEIHNVSFCPPSFTKDPFFHDVPILNNEVKNSINYTKYTIHADLLFNLEQIHEFFCKEVSSLKTGGKTHKSNQHH